MTSNPFIEATWFPDATTSQGLLYRAPWSDFVQSFGQHQQASWKKTETPCFSPTVFQDNRRSRSNARKISMGVLDFDGIEPNDLAQCLDHLKERDYIFLLYSTWSHDASNGHYRTRVVLPFERQIDIKIWQVAWPGFLSTVIPNQQLLDRLWELRDKVKSDGKIKRVSILDHCIEDTARIYFGPYVPTTTPLESCILFSAGTRALSTAFENTGNNLTVATYEPNIKVKLPRDVLKRIAGNLRRRKKAEFLELGWRLERVIAGESFAQDGERDDAIWRLAVLLADHLPHADPIALADHFAPSLQIMALEADECPTVETVAYKLERAQDKTREKRAKRQKLDADEIATRRANGWRLMGVHDRNDTYTEQEMDAFADREGCTVEELSTRMVIRQSNMTYLFGNGEYFGPFITTQDAPLAVDQILAPAPHVQLYRTKTTGEIVPRSIDWLTRKYGTISRHTIVDMTAQRNYYDAARAVMVEAPYPLRSDIGPEYSPQVAQWLSLLTHTKHNLVLGWLADLPNLQYPCAALFLYGEGGSGKSLLANGMARLWNIRGPTPLNDAMEPFNDALLSNPLLFADEHMPTNYKGEVRSEELRQMIQAHEFPLRRKFLPVATLRGCPRVYLAANKEDMLTQAGDLAAADIGAIAERFILARVSEEATRYLQTIDHHDWVDNDIIAKHILWLHYNHGWVPQGRFRHRDDSGFLQEILTVRTGTRFAVCNFLVRYLQNPRLIDLQLQGDGICIRDRHLLVRAGTIAEHWTKYMAFQRVPEVSKIAKALRGISRSRKPRIKIGTKVKTFQQVSTRILIAWARDNDIMSAAEIQECLVNNTVLS